MSIFRAYSLRRAGPYRSLQAKSRRWVSPFFGARPFEGDPNHGEGYRH
jgi:hypothetical protein